MEQNLVLSCLDAVCRNLANCESDLPSGIPQELVDDIFAFSGSKPFSSKFNNIASSKTIRTKEEAPSCKSKGSI